MAWIARIFKNLNSLGVISLLVVIVIFIQVQYLFFKNIFKIETATAEVVSIREDETPEMMESVILSEAQPKIVDQKAKDIIKDASAESLIGHDRACFLLAMNYILENEGGYSNDKRDRGGETKYGISKKSFPNVDIKNLTIEEAEKIYKREYWDKLKLDDIEDDELRIKLFDMAVNFGVGSAIKLAKNAFETLFNVEKYPDTPEMTDELIADINNIEHGRLLKVLVSLCRKYYDGIVAKNSTMKVFIKGWHKRANRDPDDFTEANKETVDKIKKRLEREKK